jgi:hypothetical protein
MKPRHPSSAAGQQCRGLTPAMYRMLPTPERKHFMRCSKCEHYFDAREFDQVAAHCFLDHDRCVPEAKALAGIRGKPVTIRKFKVIPLGQTKAIKEFDGQQKQKASSGVRR